MALAKFEKLYLQPSNSRPRRHSSYDIGREIKQDIDDGFITPMPPKSRRQSLAPIFDLANAPIKKDNLKQRRYSAEEMASQKRSHIRKRLDFDSVEDGGRKRSSAFMAALHNNDLAVPFSELDVCNRSAKRVRFHDEVSTSPVPETPVYDSSFRFGNKCIQSATTSDTSYTKLSDPMMKETFTPKLFNTEKSSIDKLCGTRKRSARNLSFALMR